MDSLDDQLQRIASRALEDDFLIDAESLRKDGSRNRLVGHLVFVIPGIRDQGEVLDRVTHLIERVNPTIKVSPIKYDSHFGAVRLFMGLSRNRRCLAARRKIEPYLDDTSIHKISFICHSFGTYVLSDVLPHLDNTKIQNIILCGSIMPRTYDWESLVRRDGRCPIKVVNECSAKDIYPVLAESLSDAYSATGVYGFGSAAVYDRKHLIGHGDYFKEDFIEKFWVPIFSEDQVRNGEDCVPKNHLFNLLSKPIIRLKHSILLLIFFAVCFSVLWYLLVQ